MLAIQLTAAPEVLLLDEPTRGLDYQAKQALLGILRTLAGEGCSVLVATHDVEFVAAVADRVLVLAEGELVADGPTGQVIVASPAFAPQTAEDPQPAALPHRAAGGRRARRSRPVSEHRSEARSGPRSERSESRDERSRESEIGT